MEIPSGSRVRTWGAATLVAAATFWVFAPVGRHPFLPWDDGTYVFENQKVLAGLSLEGARWSFATLEAANWHPLTWLSHMLDVELFGLDAGAHHISSVVVHAAAALLLLAVLHRLTGRLWRSALVSLLFAIHPLHVESVAWVAERKDVLSGLLGMLALAAWIGYARKPGAARYLLVVFVFSLGLMAKPMLVSLPAVLLLIDFWPLGRFLPPRSPERGVSATLVRLVVEKAPLIALSLAASVTAWVGQSRFGKALVPLDLIPLGARLANAAVSGARYLADMVLPRGLAFYYPFPIDGHPLPAVAAAAALLGGLTLLALREHRRRPWIATGWGWYLATLLPVAGLVQAGFQARADRYTYLPLIGPFVLAVWSAAELVPRRRWRGPSLAAAGCLVGILCGFLARRQVGYWGDTETLARRALAVTSGNWVARVKLAAHLHERGREGESLRLYREASTDPPARAQRHFDRGVALAGEGREREAASEYLLATRLYPPYAVASFNLGLLEARLGETAQAADHLRAAVAYRPDFVEAHFERGVLLAREGQWEEAAAHFSEVVRLDPEHPGARYNLQVLLEGLGLTRSRQ